MLVDRSAAERAISAFLTALGHDPAQNSELRDTPSRVVDAFARELLGGYAVDVAALLGAESEPITPGTERGLVVLRDIAIATMCPHHLLPGTGRATIAYLPGARLAGIGTLARVADAFARRLTLQEVIGEEVVKALVEHAGARGALCIIELRHTCLAARGARQSEASVVTVAQLGTAIDLAVVRALGGP